MKRIRILSGTITVSAELNETATADDIWKSLPFEGTVNTWGDEIYFDIPAEIEEESDARADVAVGELGYWAPGQAFCIFFGRTPASVNDAPRAASPVNVFGKISGDAAVFRQVPDGADIRVEKAATPESIRVHA